MPNIILPKGVWIEALTSSGTIQNIHNYSLNYEISNSEPVGDGSNSPEFNPSSRYFKQPASGANLWVLSPDYDSVAYITIGGGLTKYPIGGNGGGGTPAEQYPTYVQSSADLNNIQTPFDGLAVGVLDTGTWWTYNESLGAWQDSGVSFSGTANHPDLLNRNAPQQHTLTAIVNDTSNGLDADAQIAINQLAEMMTQSSSSSDTSSFAATLPNDYTVQNADQWEVLPLQFVSRSGFNSKEASSIASPNGRGGLELTNNFSIDFKEVYVSGVIQLPNNTYNPMNFRILAIAPDVPNESVYLSANSDQFPDPDKVLILDQIKIGGSIGARADSVNGVPLWSKRINLSDNSVITRDGWNIYVQVNSQSSSVVILQETSFNITAVDAPVSSGESAEGTSPYNSFRFSVDETRASDVGTNIWVPVNVAYNQVYSQGSKALSYFGQKNGNAFQLASDFSEKAVRLNTGGNILGLESQKFRFIFRIIAYAPGTPASETQGDAENFTTTMILAEDSIEDGADARASSIRGIDFWSVKADASTGNQVLAPRDNWLIELQVRFKDSSDVLLPISAIELTFYERGGNISQSQADISTIEATYPTTPVILSLGNEVEIARFSASDIIPEKKYRIFFNAKYDQTGGGSNTRSPIIFRASDGTGTFLIIIFDVFNEVDRYLPIPSCTALRYSFVGDVVVTIENLSNSTIAINYIRATIE